MSKTFTFFCMIIFFVSCHTKQANDKEHAHKMSGFTDSIPLTQEYAIIDNLNNYASADSLMEFPYYRMYASKINGEYIGLVQTSGSATLLYQKILNKWTVTDTLTYPLYAILPTDINGDHYLDVIITYFVTASGGNSENICLLYDPVTRQFKHNKHYDLPNIHYDRKSNLVFSAWWSGATNSQEEMAYKICGDSLTFIEKVAHENLHVSSGP